MYMYMFVHVASKKGQREEYYRIVKVIISWHIGQENASYCEIFNIEMT